MARRVTMFTVLALIVLTTILVGCGKSSSSSSNPVAASTNTAVTVSGSISSLPMNDALASIRGAATSTINYSKFSVTLTDGTATSTAVVPNATTGAFTVSLSSIANSTLIVVATHNSGKIVLKHRLLGVTAGTTLTDKVVSTVSTARALMMEANGLLTESSFDNPATLMTMNSLRQVLDDYLASASPASTTALLDLPAINNVISTVANNSVAVVTQAYASLSTLLVNNTQTADARTAAFMAYVAPDFRDTAGNATNSLNASVYSELQSSLLSRFTRYDVIQYSFTMLSFSINTQGTVLSVPTQIDVHVALKAGQTGAVSEFEGRVLTVSNENPTLLWAKQSDGSWKLAGGLPFRSDEVSF